MNDPRPHGAPRRDAAAAGVATSDDSRSPSDPVIEARNLTVRYGRKSALDGASFAVERGSIFALLGRNGAGKSSAIRCLLGLRAPDGGSAELFGRSAWSDRRELMARVGVVSESPDVPRHATAAAAGRFVAALRPAFDADAFARRLDQLDVPPKTPFRTLSRGQQTLVQLALALSADPELLILDDPTLGLDAVARRALFQELVDTLAERDVTVLLTSHDLDGVERLATHVGILAQGRLVETGPLDELRSRWSRWVVPSGAEPDLPAGFELVSREPTAWGGESWITRESADAVGTSSIPGVTREAMTLEEIFVARTARSASNATSSPVPSDEAQRRVG